MYLDPKKEKVLMEALNVLNDNTCLKFVKRNGERSFLKFYYKIGNDKG